MYSSHRPSHNTIEHMPNTLHQAMLHVLLSTYAIKLHNGAPHIMMLLSHNANT